MNSKNIWKFTMIFLRYWVLKKSAWSVSNLIFDRGEFSGFVQLNHSTDHCLNVIPISKLWKDESDLLSFWANGCNCSGNFEILGFTKQAINLSLQLHIMSLPTSISQYIGLLEHILLIYNWWLRTLSTLCIKVMI